MNAPRGPRTNVATLRDSGRDGQDATQGATTGATYRDAAGKRSNSPRPWVPCVTGYTFGAGVRNECVSGAITYNRMTGGFRGCDDSESR